MESAPALPNPPSKLVLGLIAASLLSLAVATPGSAAITQVIGLNEVSFAWEEAAGSPDAYLVSVARNYGPSMNYRLVFEPKVRIPVLPDDRIAIEVQALRYRPQGGVDVSPSSGLSDEVWVLAAPRFAIDGEWTLDCASCPAVQLRSLADASEVLAEAPSSKAPWKLVGRGALAESGHDALIWYNPVQGRVALRSADDLTLLPDGSGFVGAGLRYVGTDDFDRDGVDEIVFFDPAEGWIDLFGLTPGGIEWVGAISAPLGAIPVAMGDFTGDGLPEFAWRTLGLDRVEIQGVIGGVLSGTARAVPLLGLLSLGNVASIGGVGDFDGDGHLDLALKLTDVGLAIAYLQSGRLVRTAVLPPMTGDEDRRVVGAVDVDGDGADELALQDTFTRRISILFPTSELSPLRARVLTPGSDWWVVDVR